MLVISEGISNKQNINERVDLLMNSEVDNIGIKPIVSKGVLSTFKRKSYFFVKRLFDIICATIGCLFLLPLLIIVKICYLISGDFHSVIYKQKRIGKNGKEFNLYKFRTMVYDADEQLKKLLKNKEYKKQWDENQKLDNDPRITKIGNFLRKTSLDESLQFLSVIAGDMSMIGPRPLVKGELDAHNGNHELYESVKPGITGWWANCIRNDFKGVVYYG